MRRKDREITDFNEIMKIIDKCDVCRLALFDDDYPYIFPLNFGVAKENDQLYLYFYCANQGKKLDLIRQNNKATFEMDCEHNIILYKERMSCTMGYASVIGHGTVEHLRQHDGFALPFHHRAGTGHGLSLLRETFHFDIMYLLIKQRAI